MPLWGLNLWVATTNDMWAERGNRGGGEGTARRARSAQRSASTTIAKGQTAAHFCPAELLSRVTRCERRVCRLCVSVHLSVCLSVCDNVLFKCNNFNCNLPREPPCVSLARWVTLSAVVSRVCECVWRPTDCQLAFIYVWLTWPYAGGAAGNTPPTPPPPPQLLTPSPSQSLGCVTVSSCSHKNESYDVARWIYERFAELLLFILLMSLAKKYFAAYITAL